jgi:hypothetical protein
VPAVGGIFAIEGSDHASGEGMTPPLKPKPGSPLEERVARLEENIEILSGSIVSQAEARRRGDRELRGRVDAVAESVHGRLDEVRRLVDEASVPERMEWWGLSFVLVGAALSLAVS